MWLGIPAGFARAARCPAIIFLAVTGLIGGLWQAPGIAFGTSPNSVPEYRSDRILVQPKRAVSRADLARLHAAHGTQVLRTLSFESGLQLVSVPPGKTVAGLLKRYQLSGLVEFAEPDYLVRTATIPDDPKFLDGTLWGLNQIDAPQGWDVQNSASNIVVAVLDTGVRYTHEDLASNMWVNPVDHSHGLDALTGTNDPSDDSGHGTMVAGVLGAVGNNGIGVVGVAWRVQILACKCFDQFGIGDISSCITCLDYAATNQARLINASWGFPTNSLAFSNALWSVRAAGIIVVAAAGNNGTNIDLSPSYPSSYHFDNVVSVAYSTRDDLLGSASNYGANSVHLAAPGENIYSTFAASDSYYYTLSGSSFSAPYVTGALALILAKYPGESYQESIARLLNGTDPVPALAGKCVTGGRLNLQNALSSPIRLVAVPALPPGLTQFRVVSAPARTCVVQSSQDLKNWSPVFTNITSATGAFDFTPAPLTNPVLHFYRAVSSL